MIHSIFASSDATIYSGSLSDDSVGTQNTGLDEILEIEKWNISAFDEDEKPVGVDDLTLSRALVKFDLAELSRSIVDNTIPKNSKYYLNLYTCEAKEIPLSYTIFVYPISQSWEMGIGKKADYPITEDGVTWNWRDYSGSNSWNGGNWYSGSLESTQSFEFETSDIRMDVSPIIRYILSSSLDIEYNSIKDKYYEGSNTTNYGLIVKRSGSEEIDTATYGTLQFYSRDTHTIYQPKIEVCWDDSSWVIGSLSPIDTTEDIVIYTKGMKDEYNFESKEKIRVLGRVRFPVKTYSTSSNVFANPYANVTYLPTSSYYSVKDAYTEDTVIPFDNDYTKLSCDGNGNYFKLWMDGLQPERYYRFIFKIERENDRKEYFDNKYIFKVIR